MSIPDESTLSPEATQRALAQAHRSRRRDDTLFEKAEATFDKSRAIGEGNGFVDTLRELIRGAA